jgi:hypothetical protein
MYPLLPPLLSLLLAPGCAPDKDGTPGERPDLSSPEDTAPADTGSPDTEPPPPEDTAPPEDTSPPEDTEPPPDITYEDIGDHDLDDSWIFSHEAIHEVELTLPADSWTALFADPYTYVEAGFRFDGEALDTVGVRLRGKIGSFRDLNGKPKFKIDFNQFIEDQRFYGLETLSLNNEIVDCSYLKEPLGYALFEAMGVPASRTGFATLTVNGQPYGLFVIVEVPDDRFLRRAYEEPEGNLYDGKYIWYGDYNYTLLDFASGVDDLFQLEEGKDVGNADITAVSDALVAARYQTGFVEAMDPYIDWENFHRVWAGEHWLGQNDGYVLNTNNYRVYFDPTDGRANFVPWDLDYSFLYDYEWGMDWFRPRGTIASYCLADPECTMAQRDALSRAIDAAEKLDLPGLHTQLAALIADEVAADPRRECSTLSVNYEQAEVVTWLTARSDQLREEWGL